MGDAANDAFDEAMKHEMRIWEDRMNTATRIPSPDDTVIVGEAPLKVNPVAVIQRTPRVMQSERASDDVAAQPKYPPSLIKAILAVTKAIGSVEKLGLNKDQNYTYQRWDDILARLSEILPEHGLLIVQTQTGQSLFEGESLVSITYDFIIMNDDGEVWPVPIKWSAAAKVRAKTGTVDDKAITKCHTQAEKYFFVKLFKIRSIEMPDSDAGEETERPKRPHVPSPDDEADGSITTFMEQCRAHLETLATDQAVKDWWASDDLGKVIVALQLPQAQVDIIKAWGVERRKAIRAASGTPPAAQNAPAATPVAPKAENAPVAASPWEAGEEAIGHLERDYTAGIEAVEKWLWSLKGQTREQIDAAWDATIGTLPSDMLFPPDLKNLQQVKARILAR